MSPTARLGILATLQAQPGKEEQLAALIAGARTMVEQEAGTLSWYAFRISFDTFGIFDTFADNEGREAHLAGAVAQALTDVADELLATPPRIEPVDVLAVKRATP